MSDAPAHLRFETLSPRVRRVQVYLGDELLCVTSRDVLKAASIDTEQADDPAEVLSLVEQTEFAVAKERALRLLGYRERTHHELQTRLTDEGLSERAISGALERLDEIGALSDERFAECYVRTKTQAGWGRPRIERGLSQKGVSPEISSPVLDEHIPPELEAGRGRQIAERWDLSTPRARERALGRLARKGFAASDALSAIKDPRPPDP